MKIVMLILLLLLFVPAIGRADAASDQSELIARQSAVIAQQAAVIKSLQAELAALKAQMGFASATAPIQAAPQIVYVLAPQSQSPVVFDQSAGACGQAGQAGACGTPGASGQGSGWYLGKFFAQRRAGACQ